MGYLARVREVQQGSLVNKNIVDRRDLEQVVDQLLSLSVEQRRILGNRARASYLEQKQMFHKAMAKAFLNR
jgi:hypothetical protein